MKSIILAGILQDPLHKAGDYSTNITEFEEIILLEKRM